MASVWFPQPLLQPPCLTGVGGWQVVLALQILDGAPFRPDMSKTMTVQRAHFQMHGDQFIPRKKPKKKKKKAGAALDKMLGWGGFDDVRKATDVRPAPIV